MLLNQDFQIKKRFRVDTTKNLPIKKAKLNQYHEIHTEFRIYTKAIIIQAKKQIFKNFNYYTTQSNSPIITQYLLEIDCSNIYKDRRITKKH